MYPVKPSTSSLKLLRPPPPPVSFLMSFVCLSGLITSPSHLAAEGGGHCPLSVPTSRTDSNVALMLQIWDTCRQRGSIRKEHFSRQLSSILRKKRTVMLPKISARRKKHLFMERSLRPFWPGPSPNSDDLSLLQGFKVSPKPPRGVSFVCVSSMSTDTNVSYL